MSVQDFLADAFLGASDWERARSGLGSSAPGGEGDWWDLISGAAMGAAALTPLGAGRGAAKGVLRRQMGDELVDGAGLVARGADAAPGPRLDPVVEDWVGASADTLDAGRAARAVDDWTPGLVDTELGPVPEAMPGARGAWTTDTIEDGRALAVRQRAAAMESNALANPEFEAELAGLMAKDPAIEQVMEGLAPAGMYDLNKGNLKRLPDIELFDRSGSSVAMRRGGEVVPGRVDAPLSRELGEGGLNLSPSPYNRPELALPVLAARWKTSTGAARQRAKEEFAREFTRQGQSAFGLFDSTIKDGPVFYLDRAEQIGRAASRVTDGAGQEAFSPQVLAAATAASSSNAAPIEEPIRLLLAAPFIRMKNGKAVFDDVSLAAMREAHGDIANSDMFYNGAKTLAEMLNNPNMLTRKMPGLGHKTHPYAVLGMDPENPWAFVADRNLWYLAQSHNRAGMLGGPRGGRAVALADKDPMGAKARGSVGTSSLMRGLASAVGQTPGTVQEVIWFLPRILQQGDIADSFVLSRSMSQGADTFLRNKMGDQYMDALYGLMRSREPGAQQAAAAAWSDLLGDAAQAVGSHWGPENVTALRSLGARTSSEFSEQVAAGQVRGWQMLNGRPVPARDQWRNTLAPDDVYTKGALDKGAAVGGVDRLEAPAQTGLVTSIEQAMETLPAEIAGIWKRLSEGQKMYASSLFAAGIGAAEAVRRASASRGEVTEDDVTKTLNAMDDVATGWV